MYQSQKIFFCFSLVLFFACISSCKRSESKTTEIEASSTKTTLTHVTLTSEQITAANIQTGKPEMRVVSGAIKVNGVLDVPPQNLVSISAPLGGFVKHTDLLQGMKVTKGQSLVTLEGPEYIQLQEEYLSSESQLKYLSQEYERQQELARENVNAAKSLQQAEAAFRSAQAKYKGLAARLSLIHLDLSSLESGNIQNSIGITSPISGFISQVNINLGMHVNPTDVLFRIIDTDHLHAEAQVFEKDISKVKVGQKVRISLSNDSHERIATVYLIGKEITAERTVRVHCHLDEEDATLIPGMYFTGIIEIDHLAVATLPEDAIVPFDGKSYVFIPQSATEFEMKEIQTGPSSTGFIQVLSFDVNQPVVVKGAYELLSQLKNSEK